MHISAKQIRAARVLLDWTQQELAERAGVSKDTVLNLENEKGGPQQAKYEKIIQALRDGGIEFLENNGVRQAEHSVRILQGKKGFLEFYEEVYQTVRQAENKTVYVSNVDERQFVKWQGEQLTEHAARMAGLGVRYSILLRHGDTYFPAAAYAEYRWLPESMFYSVPLYMYGEKLAMLIFEEEPRIYILNEPEISKVYRKQFEELWAQSTKAQG